MGSLKDQINDYRGRVKDNYQTLIDLLHTSSQVLTTLLNEKDPPKPDNPTFIETALDLALKIVLPEVLVFVKAKTLSQAAVAVVKDLEMGIGHVKAVPKVIDAARKLADVKAGSKPQSATIGMMESIKRMHLRLQEEKAAAADYFQSVVDSLPEKEVKTSPAAKAVDWKLPELLGRYADDLQYVFEYILIRETVQRYGEVRIWVNEIWDWPNTANIVLEMKLNPFSETSTKWIFSNLNRRLERKALPGSANVPGGPATDRIEPVTNMVLLAAAWQPRVTIEAVKINFSGGERYRNFLKGERLHSTFIHLHKTSQGYVPRLNKFGAIDGYDDAITAHWRKLSEQGKK